MSGNIIGQPLPRADGAAKVTGAARYALDTRQDGMLHAALACAAVSKGRITALDTAAAEAAPGVRLVLTHRNHPRLHADKGLNDGGSSHATFRPLESDEVRFHGQAIVLVVADTRVQAEHAASLVRARFATAPAVAVFGAPGLTVAEAPREPNHAHGDAARALREAAVRVEARYETPTQHHNAIELFGCVASWEGDRLLAQFPSQGVGASARGLATVFGLAKENVRVQSAFVGGGFGGKGSLLAEVVATAAAARMVGRPVKLLLPREQSYGNSSFRPATEMEVKLGATAEGRLVALDYECRSQTSRFDAAAFPGGTVAAKLYAVENADIRERVVAMDINTPGFMRAPGEVPSMFAVESAVDELCAALRMDPVAFRRLNDAPRDLVADKEWSSHSMLACWERAAELFGWARRSAAPGSMTEKGELVGWGCAAAAYPTMISSSAATVAMEADGRVSVRTSAADLGTGTYTTLAQVAAQSLGIEPGRVRVELGDTAFAPGNLAGGSTTALASSNAVKQTAEQLRAAILRAAAPLAGGDAAALRLESGEVRGGSRAIPLAEILRAAPGGRMEATSQWAHPEMPAPMREVLWQGGFPMLPPPRASKSALAWGAEFVEVRVNPLTRTIRVPRMVGVFAGGTILNARTARSQLMGGMVWGVGNALLEKTETDARRASFANNNLAEYHVAVNADIGEVVIETIEERDDFIGPIGAKGLGEISITGVAPAIANAVFHATGIRVRKTPILLEDILPDR